jgi:hypothetical protein
MEDDAYIARKVFPAVPVAKQSDKYYVWTRADLLRSEAQYRAPGARIRLRDFAVSDAQYYVKVMGVGHAISEQDQKNADPGVNLEEGIVRGLVQDLKIAEEINFGAVAFGTSAWGTNGAPSPTWENAAAYPLKDLATAIRTIQYNTGRLANTLAVGAETWYSGLLNHSDIIDRLPDNAPRIATPNFIANLLGLSQVLVATAGYNSGTEGGTASYSSILGDSAVILYVNPNAGLLSATAGAMFVWSGLEGSVSGMRVQREYIPVEDAMPLITVELAATPKIIASELGYHYYSTIT